MIHALSPLQASDLLRQVSVQIIDVRDEREWLDGHIEGARHIPLATLRADPTSVVQGQPLLFVCAAGVRSETAARLALVSGAERVYNLVGGTRAWMNAGLPFEHELAVSAAE